MDREKLWNSYQVNRDSGFRDKLIESYLTLVKKIVGRMTLKLPAHWDNEDVISHGIIGLIEAVERFNPSKGVKFETFASIRIRGAIIDALREASLIPRKISDDLSKVARAIESLEQENLMEISSEHIAKKLNMSVKEIDEIMVAFSHLSCVSLQETLKFADSDGEDFSLMDTLSGPEQYEPENQITWGETKDKLVEAINNLPKKEQIVLALYYYEELTLKEIACIIDVTESRVSQIKSNILLKMRAFLEKGN